MTRQKVGTVGSLWRYPVKSMLGQQLKSTSVNGRGLLGDRGYALWDVKTARVASAKNPKRWAKLLDFQAEYSHEPQPSAPLPAVKVLMPDGRTVASNDNSISEAFSTFFQRDIHLLSEAPENVSLDQFWPDVEGTPRQNEVTELLLPEGTFFDSCSIHLISTTTLASLQEAYPEGTFDIARFRPNILIEPLEGMNGFVEEAWVGENLSIGDEVTLSIDTLCPRCVVTTLAQSELPDDLGILRTAAKHNNLIAGIRASVLEVGTIREGDPIYLESRT
ncbi:MAG: MOSC domain-containing protein [Synechococcus sp.]